jgi:hypothetical protein
MPLSITEYDRRERRAKCALSFQEVLAFASTAMEVTGFPARLKSESQIASYMDWNDGDNTGAIFEPDSFIPVRALRTTFTSEEVGLARTVADAVARLTKERTGREMRPIGTLLAVFGLFRIIQAMKAAWSLPQISVFEIGPGTGYLGPLLALTGDRYAATDNSQAFYLWQNRLLSTVAGEEFWDWAEMGPPSTGPRIQHLPWWDYVKLRDRAEPRADIFVANCNLGEMNPYALKYTTQIARRLVGDSPIGYFLYVSIGNPLHASAESIEQEILRRRFRRIYGKLFNCFSARTVIGVNDSNLDKDIPLFGNGPTTDAQGLLRAIGVDRFSLPFDIDFLSFLGFENHFVDHPAFKSLIGTK